MQIQISRASLLMLAVFSLGWLIPLQIQGQQGTPAETELALQRARTAFRRNDLETAKRELKGLLNGSKTLPEAFLLAGLIAEQEKKTGDAIKYLKNAVQLQADYALANFVLARLYFA